MRNASRMVATRRRVGVSFHRILIAIGLLTACHSLAQAQQPVLGQGNTVVTGFSGTATASAAAASSDPLDSLFIDVEGASARIMNIQAGGQPPQAQVLPGPTVWPVKAGEVGQVFGIALDDGKGADGTGLGTTPDIYLSASSAFGLQIVATGPAGQPQRLKLGQAGAQWMAGQWGSAATGGTPGSIWKVSGTTGAVSLLANVVLNGQTNSGPGLGNLAFDPRSRQIFVSDLGTGMIHRFDLQGHDLGYYDHGTQGRPTQGLASVPYDPADSLDITSPSFNVEDAASWHYAPKSRMVWGLKISPDGRLYYAAAEGPQIWSIAIGQDGSFGTDPRLEIDVKGTASTNAISDVTFDGPDTIYLAQRGVAHGDYSYETFAETAKSDVLRYHRDAATGAWMQVSESYAVGFPPDLRNTNGGVAIDRCTQLVWTTGELLRQGAGMGAPENVHGLQGMDKGLVRPANEPPKHSYFVQYNSAFEDPAAHGHLGDVEIWHPCAQSTGQTEIPYQPPTFTDFPPQGGFNLTLTKAAVPYKCPPGVLCKLLPPSASPTDCVANGSGWFCSYRVIVSNSGTTVYQGPLTFEDTVVDAPAGTTVNTTALPLWHCHAPAVGHVACNTAPVTLNPGDSSEVGVVVNVPPSYQGCELVNTARLNWPASYGDANPYDDFGFAVAHIPNAACNQPPPHGNTNNLQIKKLGAEKCLAYQADWVCSYVVIVTNTGPAMFSGSISIDEHVGLPLNILSKDAWSCVGAPPDYHCSVPAITLNPGQSTGFMALTTTKTIDLQPGQCSVTNHVHIALPAGGSAQNTDAADDDASATTPIPSPNCKPTRLPGEGGQHTDLKIRKTAKACVATDYSGKQGYDCAYTVTISNDGATDFAGDVEIVDEFGAKPDEIGLPSSLNSPWVCALGLNQAGFKCQAKGVTIGAGQSISLTADGYLSASQVAGGQCSLANTVHLVMADGSQHMATAAAGVVIASCLPHTPPANGGGTGHVSIMKTCRPNAVGQPVQCTITLKNDGGEPITSAIRFTDTGTWAGGGQMQIESITPNNPAFSCNGLPQSLSCQLPGSALPPGGTASLGVLLKPDTSQAAYKNCASLVSENGSVLTGYGHTSCFSAANGGELSIVKTGPASCTYGGTCTFEVTVTNNASQPYSGDVLLGDQAFFNGEPAHGLQIVSFNPALNCEKQGTPASLPFTCRAAATLAAGEAKTLTIAVKMPAGFGGTPLSVVEGSNCAFVIGGSDDDVDTASVIGQFKAGQNPSGSGVGYSCAAFKLVPAKPESILQPACPAGMIASGTQCVCPAGMRYANGHCIGLNNGGGGAGGGSGPIVIPIVPTDIVCLEPLRRLRNGKCCPQGSYADGDICRLTQPKPVKQVCAPPLSGDFPNCHCPDGGRYYPDRNVCIKQPGPPPARSCPAPAVGSLPNCTCPSPREQWNGQACVLKPAAGGGSSGSGGITVPKACPPPASGLEPNCSCPAGQRWTGSACHITGTGSNGIKGTEHACPSGEKWNGSACVRPPLELRKFELPNSPGLPKLP